MTEVAVGRTRALVAWVLLVGTLVSQGSNAFTPTTSSQKSRVRQASGWDGIRGKAASDATSTTAATVVEEDAAIGDDKEALSDVDARVLRQMLQDNDKLDLQTEENMRELLERGTTKKEATATSFDQSEAGEDDDSQFSSEVFKRLSDTTLWQKLSKQAEDVFQSLSIIVQNKIEQDAMKLAALGLFAWDRVVRDVNRALPQATSFAQQQTKKILFLSNQTSAATMTNDNNNNNNDESLTQPSITGQSLYDEMITPQDEISSVTSAIKAILFDADEAAATTAAGRGLRTASASRQERVQRATQRFEKQKKQQQTIIPTAMTTLPGAVVDSAYELKREMQVETSRPGYRSTQPATKAFQAAASQTQGVLQGAKQLWQLERKKAEQGLLSSSSSDSTATTALGDATIVSNNNPHWHVDSRSSSPVNTVVPEYRPAPQELFSDLLKERQALADRLQNCISNPEATWLSPDKVLREGDYDVHVDSDVVRSAVEYMIDARNVLQQPVVDDTRNVQLVLEQMTEVVTFITQTIQPMACKAVSDRAGTALYEELLLSSSSSSSYAQAAAAVNNNESVDVTTLLQTIQQQIYVVVDSPLEDDNVENPRMHTTAAAATTVQAQPPEMIAEPAYRDVTVLEHNVVDVATELDERATTSTTTVEDATASFVAAEVVSEDEDWEAKFGSAKSVESVNEMEQEKDEENIVLDLALRSLDISFFVVEKTFTTVIPQVIESSKVATYRVKNLKEEGLGSEGWRPIRNANTGANRY